jgi:ligand-binding SRPBCC domain-containing protein
MSPTGGSSLHQLRTEILLPRPVEEVFAFFSDARNLGRITPPWLRFGIASADDLAMREGLLIDYRIRLYGIPLRWRSEITAWDPPHRFVDEQHIGPYRTWIHEHTFAAERDGTRVRDHVRYLPRGGGLVHHWFVRPSLERVFSYRTRVLLEILGRASA